MRSSGGSTRLDLGGALRHLVRAAESDAAMQSALQRVHAADHRRGHRRCGDSGRIAQKQSRCAARNAGSGDALDGRGFGVSRPRSKVQAAASRPRIEPGTDIGSPAGRRAQALHPDRSNAIIAAAEAVGRSRGPAVSGAGRDAVHTTRASTTGMIVAPCEHRMSHDEIENPQPAHLEAGCNVLLRVTLNRAGVTA